MPAHALSVQNNLIEMLYPVQRASVVIEEDTKNNWSRQIIRDGDHAVQYQRKMRTTSINLIQNDVA